ncbi:unnamed protein product [Mucor hiemalis]
MLLITGADQYIGYAIASHMAQFEHLRSQIRVLCQSKTRCHGFSTAGIDVRQVDYNHPNDLSLALRGVDHIVLAIGSEGDRVENAKHICTVAAHSGVSSIICVSSIGAVSRIHPALQDYGIIEEQVMHSTCQYTILRLDFLQQYFHLWSSYAEKQRKLLLPVNEDTEICPVDIADVCKVLESLLLCEEKKLRSTLEDEHDGQVYSLTGPEALNGKQIVKQLADATGYEQFKFYRGRPMDLGYYLRDLGKDVWFDARLKQEMSQIYHDKFENEDYKKKAYNVPTDKQVQSFLDFFDWVQRTSGSVCVPHTTMLTHEPSKVIKSFFEENANSFKPRV